ncbi:MAG: hypothetical protein ACK4SZ_02990 [Allosphingosinicella sp.]|uniref:hypothetical protein n=1 Tax=Allosphingosinicella sp. TaxID=2823234 RepID=UPI00393B0BD4
MGTNVGKGPRARYSLEHLFQLIVVLELAELSISLPAAADLVKTYWPDSGVSLAPAHAWLMHQEGDEDSLLLLATASEREGLSAHSDEKEAATARAGAFMVGARSRPMDGLRATTLSAIMTGSKLNLSRPTLSSTVWRSSVIDCSVLVPTVVQILVDAQLLSEEQFTSWAKRHCELFIAEAETRLQTL